MMRAMHERTRNKTRGAGGSDAARTRGERPTTAAALPLLEQSQSPRDAINFLNDPKHAQYSSTSRCNFRPPGILH